MKDEDFQDLLDEINTMSNEEYDEYHKKALNIKKNEEMTEESMFCDENGKPLPRKNKFDKGLYKKVLECKRIDPTKFTVTETGQVIKPQKSTMTDDEKAEKYVRETYCKDCDGKHYCLASKCFNIHKKDYLEGLVEGRKKVTYMKASEYDEYLNVCRDNERLKADLEEAWKHCKAVDEVNAKLRNCGNCTKRKLDYDVENDVCEISGAIVYCNGKCSKWEMKE